MLRVLGRLSRHVGAFGLVAGLIIIGFTPTSQVTGTMIGWTITGPIVLVLSGSIALLIDGFIAGLNEEPDDEQSNQLDR